MATDVRNDLKCAAGVTARLAFYALILWGAWVWVAMPLGAPRLGYWRVLLLALSIRVVAKLVTGWEVEE